MRELLPFRFGFPERRAFSDRCTNVSTVAHQQQRRHGCKGVNQSENPTLSLGKSERQSRKQFVLECHPERRGVHFVLGQFQLSEAHVLVGEELDLLETNDL
jgi:hypothetical protein